MGLYPRTKPRGAAEDARRVSAEARRLSHGDSRHDTRNSAIRSTTVSGGGGTGGTEVGSSGDTGPAPVVRSEVLRLALGDANRLRLVSVFSDNTATAAPNSPIDLPSTSGFRNIQGIAYSNTGLFILDDGGHQILHYNHVMGQFSAATVTGIPTGAKGITMQRSSFTQGASSIFWFVRESSSTGYIYQAVHSLPSGGNLDTTGALVSRLASANDEPVGVTYAPINDTFYIVDDNRNVYSYTRTALEAVQRASTLANALSGFNAASAGQFALDSDNRSPSGIAFAAKTVNGTLEHRLYVIDTSDSKLYAYDANVSGFPHIPAEDIAFTDIGITGRPRGISAYPSPSS